MTLPFRAMSPDTARKATPAGAFLFRGGDREQVYFVFTVAHILVALVLLCASLTGCSSIPQPPPGPQGSSAANWSNDFLRAESGIIYVVNGTWTKDNKIIFRDRQFTPEQFRHMLSEQAGITTNTPISILQEPSITAPAIEWPRFYEAGYWHTMFLSLPKRYWRWWRKQHGQPTTGVNAG